MTKLPTVTFRQMTFSENMRIMAMFINLELDQAEKINTDYFFGKFPKIRGLSFKGKSTDEMGKVFESLLFDDWNEEMKTCEDVVSDFQKNWDLINDDVMSDLSKRLNIVWPDDCMNIVAKVGVVCFCPRSIPNRTFLLNLHGNLDYMRGITIHEICHFLYFEKWKELFNDHDETHYNIPHIIWHLSEAMIDPLLNNDVFRRYTDYNLKSYDVFYDKKINNESIIDRLQAIVSEESIERAIKDSYSFFLENEQMIKGIEKAKS